MDGKWQREADTTALDANAEMLESKPHKWKPETSQKVLAQGRNAL
jgi:hypothetical protein